MGVAEARAFYDINPGSNVHSFVFRKVGNGSGRG